MANDEKTKEPTIRLHLTRPVDNGEFQAGAGEADVPESFAHSLVAGGVATVVTKKSPKAEKAEKSERSERAELTADESTADSGEDTSKKASARSRR